MPETPWISPYKIEPEADKDYIAVITYLPLNSYLNFPNFFKQSGLIQKQLHKSHGVVGFKLRADILSKKIYTMSVWEDAKSLKNFITSGAHKDIMADVPSYLGKDRTFATVFIKGSEFPPSWEWAIKMLKEN
ncbi:MAG: hypothetical protein DHS20C13_11470 [Thermodesulfobacteriota bacterium]|nr:MAG: hypothetical protein DHS20C13_11470 [Thermodesulfobacteriota bacterium]